MRKLIKSKIVAIIAFVVGTSAHAVQLGPFDATLTWCRDVQKMGQILNAFQINQWPVTGAPGIAIGMTMRNSPVLDMCNYLISIDGMDTAHALFFTADKLNEITDNRWKDQLKLTKKTWKLANSVYNFEKGESRQANLYSTSFASDLGDWALAMRDVVRKGDRVGVAGGRNFAEEGRMDALAKAARERALIKEMSTCPAGTPGGSEMDTVASGEYATARIDYEFYRDDVAFIRNQLIDLGPKFIGQMGEYKSYTKSIADLEAFGVKYTVSSKIKKESTIKKTGSMTTDASTGEEVAQTTTGTLEKNTQVWTAYLQSDMFANFRTAYQRRYINWALEYWSYYSDSESGMQKIRNEFAGWEFACSPGRLMKDKNKKDPEYQALLEKRMKSCEADAGRVLDRNKASSLINYYSEQLKESLFKMKEAQAKLWTMESYYLGHHRAVSTSRIDDPKDAANPLNGTNQEQVVCSDQLEAADMQKLALRSQQVELDLLQQTTQAVNSLVAIEMEKSKVNADEALEQKKKREIIERNHGRQIESLKDIRPPTVGGKNGGF